MCAQFQFKLMINDVGRGFAKRKKKKNYKKIEF